MTDQKYRISQFNKRNGSQIHGAAALQPDHGLPASHPGHLHDPGEQCHDLPHLYQLSQF